jgi:hypothetical protein
MPVTKQLPAEQMQEIFDGFSRRFLQDYPTTVVDIELLGVDLGDQVQGHGVHLLGITYEPRTRALEVQLESAGLRAYKTKEVWAIEEDDGFIRALAIVRDDDTKEIMRVRRQATGPADRVQRH